MTMAAESPGRASPQIAPESRKFLVLLFTDLRDDLANRADAKGPGIPGAETVAGKRAIYDALLAGLSEGGEMPQDETLCKYVVGLAEATDEENCYEQTVLEHRAFAELSWALGSPAVPGAAAVDWDGLMARLLHPTQLQIVEAMHWIGQPVSASQLVHVFDRDPKDLSAVSYHLRRLRTLKIVRLRSVRRARGAKARLYELIAAAG
jgi:DNA-binding transcriptional ArsR family regulator